MRFLSIATASVLALTAGAAFAQMSPPSSTSTTPPAATMPGANGIGGAAVAPRQPVRNPLTEQDVSQLKGTNVYGSDDKKIGDISTALMDPGSKRIDRLVVAAGGVLGVGAHHVAIPVDQFRWDADKGGFIIAQTTDQLKAMPEWQDASSGAVGYGSSTPPIAPSNSEPPR